MTTKLIPSKKCEKTTPRKQILPTGTYPAVIAAVMFHHDNPEKGQFILQIQGPKGVCYIPTYPFDSEIANEQSRLYKLIHKLPEHPATSAYEFCEWLRTKGLVNLETDEFDESVLIGSPVLANVVLKTSKTATRDDGKPVKFSVVSEMSYADRIYTLDLTKYLPRIFGRSKRYDTYMHAQLEVEPEPAEEA